MSLRKFRVTSAAAVLTTALLVTYAAPSALLQGFSTVILAGYVLGVALLLRPLAGVVMTCSAGALGWLLHEAHDIKLALTSLPLTSFDVVLAAKDPLGALSAAALSVPAQVVLVLVALGIALFIAADCVVGVLHVLWNRGRRSAAVAALTLVLSSASALGLNTFAGRVASQVKSTSQRSDLAHRQWEPNGVAALSASVGLIPFLLYSYTLHGDNSTAPWNRVGATEAVSPGVIEAAVAEYLDLRPIDPERRANIAVVLMESTFDPNRLFRLDRPVRPSVLVSGPLTHMLAPLQVNTQGGGTWISEFEALVGISHELFGYWGYYTHTSLGPYVKRTIAISLSESGYVTSAFYPTSGDFYNASKAYRKYGFREFLDGLDLGLGATWRKSDVDVMRAYLDRHHRLHGSDTAPFFSVFLSVENHSPHPCTTFRRPDQFVVRFQGAAADEMNCQLNEYVAVLDRTSRAVEMLRAYLAAEEARTGRPYVIVAFGDHVGHTFASTGGPDMSRFDYGPLRSEAEMRTTVVHVLGSARNPLRRPLGKIPITLLPTLISAYIAERAEDLYLPSNLALFAECATRRVEIEYDSRPDGRAEASPPDAQCRQTTAAVIASYKKEGIIAVP